MEMKVYNFPSRQYGYWLPVYADSDDKTVRQLVLREFRSMMTFFKLQESKFVRIKNFQWLVKTAEDLAEMGYAPMQKTYGWKCDVYQVTIQ